jgi:N-acetyl-anhydromuramyl-L-alanine amidase AmpD
MQIKQVEFTNYKNEVTKKSQIYLHHTAGGPNAENVFKFWQADATPVATCVAISQSGQIVQGFPSEKWAYHLGLTNQAFANNKMPYVNLDKISIGIELCAWGPLTKKGDKFYNYVNGVVSPSEVATLEKPFKGSVYYHKYTAAQIESTRQLLLHWHNKYGIPIKYNPAIWDISKDALAGKPGLYSHVSVRQDKSDVFPQEELIKMLLSL